MNKTNTRSDTAEGAEASRRRRQEEERLGRLAWSQSTRTGANLPAATTADLAALGARVRETPGEGLISADAAAGVYALAGRGGDGDWGRY